MAAGPITQIADVVVPREFADYIQQLTEVKSRLIMSGAVQRNATLDMKLAGGGLIFDFPSWQDLGDDSDRVSTDTAHDDFSGGSQSPSPFKGKTSQERAVRLSRNASWSAADLAEALAGSDFMGVVAARESDYWMRRAQDIFIATVKGVLADNSAAPTGTEHVEDDLTFDASGAAFVPGTTDFSAENFLAAALTAGDSQEDFVMLMVHSVVYNTMQRNNLIDFIPDSNGVVNIPTFLGRMVIVDDRMPNTAGVYDSWLFGRGFMQWGSSMPKVPMEIERRAGGGNGGGQEIFYSRREWTMHPVGHQFAVASPANGGPSNAATSGNLAHADSWVRVYPERKQIKMARLLTRES